MVQRVLVGKRDSEDVQGEPAAQGNHKLNHDGEPGQQQKRVHNSRKAKLVLCSSSSDEVSLQQAHMARQARA